MAYNQEWRVQGSRVSDDHMCYLIANFDISFFSFLPSFLHSDIHVPMSRLDTHVQHGSFAAFRSRVCDPTYF